MTTPIPYYGILVHTLPLAYAAQAFPEVQPQLIALSLLSLGRLRGTLVSRKGSNVLERVPHEVFELIKAHLIQLEVDFVERQFYKSFNCRSHYLSCEACGGMEHSKVIFEQCVWSRHRYESSGAEQGQLDAEAEKVRYTLAAHGLRVVENVAVVVDDAPFSLEVLTPITFSFPPPPRRGSTSSKLLASDSAKNGSDGSEQNRASHPPAAHPPPRNAVSIFGAFVNLFRLPTATSSEYEAFLCASMRSQEESGNEEDGSGGDVGEAEEEKADQRNVEKSGSEPRWLMVSTE